MRVKIFVKNNVVELEEEINKFIKYYDGDIEVVDIKLTGAGAWSIAALIQYKEKKNRYAK